jgi:hypothetical protein
MVDRTVVVVNRANCCGPRRLRGRDVDASLNELTTIDVVAHEDTG